MNRQNAVLRKPLPARTEFGFALNWEVERVKKRSGGERKWKEENGGGETKMIKTFTDRKTEKV
jgi:hypothetical protein